MMTPPERSPERDAVVTAMLAHVAFDGWTKRALTMALTELRMPADEAELLFPGGAQDMVGTWCDLADRRMIEGAAALDFSRHGLTRRVRAVVALRLAQNRTHKEAARRALAVFALPGHAALAAACTARTVDAIWHAAGDRAADFSWYTKRAVLAAVYAATVLFWLRDTTEDDALTLAFLDRRLADVGQIGRLRRRAMEVLKHLGPSFRRPA